MSNTIDSLIVRTPEIRHGRPRIAGTGITIHRIAIWHNLGHSPEDITFQYPHLTLAQVHAALAYYFANRDEVDEEIQADEIEADQIEQEYLNARKSA